MKINICLLVFLFLYTTRAEVSFITKCRSSDAKCTRESAQAAIPIYASGVPELGIEPLDPLFVPKADASSPSLKLVLTDVTVTGLKGCIAKKIQRDVAKSKLYIKVQCDVKLEGQYVMKGRLLILPIEGEGPLHVDCKKMVISLDVDIGEKIGKDGKNHWDIKRFTHTYDLKDKSTVIFENLFNGNQVLAQAANELVSNSGNEIVLEVGPPVVKEVATTVVASINRFFHAVLPEDLSLD